MMNNLGLIPLKNFCKVDTNLYRSAQPQYDYEYRWLKKVLGIDVIINLRSEMDMDAKFSIKHDIMHFTIPVKDHNPPSDENVEQFRKYLDLFKDKKVLFHCEHGHGRTSTFCVIARIHKGWSLEDALREEQEKFHFTFKHKAQTKFLKQKFQ